MEWGRCDERVSRASMGHHTRADDGSMHQQVAYNISTGYTWFFLNVDLTLARESNKPLLLWQSSCASVSCRVSGGATARLQARGDVKWEFSHGRGGMVPCERMRVRVTYACSVMSLCMCSRRTSSPALTWRTRTRLRAACFEKQQYCDAYP